MVTTAGLEDAVEVGRGVKEVDFPITVNRGGLVVMGYGLGWTSFMFHGTTGEREVEVERGTYDLS